MKYISTRNTKTQVDFDRAVLNGISREGGLFVPAEFKQFSKHDIENMQYLSYCDLAVKVLKNFMSDYDEEEIKTLVNNAYTGKFDNEEIAPVVKVGNDYVLELWHGPTCAFKDMALQLLPQFITSAIKRTNQKEEMVILVATSGDTGKAALEGFKDVKGTKIIVYYPSEGVSKIQKLQMATQEGGNVSVIGIKGNFDDAQTAVKKAFVDSEVNVKLNKNNMVFSSANSINFGRLCPQIVYYFRAYAKLLRNGEIKLGDKINFVVPTGNFGNILAAYYAKKMGLPINRLICASNSNKVLSDFIDTGVYNKNRSFYQTISPSMDILISSNLERLLFDLANNDPDIIISLMEQLRTKGEYKINSKMKAAMNKVFYGGFADDKATKQTISNVFIKNGYLCDTHTAVAVNVCEQYKEKTNDKTKCVIVSTASPFKFSQDVLSAFYEKLDETQAMIAKIENSINKQEKDEFEIIKELEEISFIKAPDGLKNLKDKKIRFDTVIDKNDIVQSIFKVLDIS